MKRCVRICLAFAILTEQEMCPSADRSESSTLTFLQHMEKEDTTESGDGILPRMGLFKDFAQFSANFFFFPFVFFLCTTQCPTAFFFFLSSSQFFASAWRGLIRRLVRSHGIKQDVLSTRKSQELL